MFTGREFGLGRLDTIASLSGGEPCIFNRFF
jgi:hypothetical protein